MCERGRLWVFVSAVVSHISCMLTAPLPVQVTLMRRRGYGGAAEGHIHLVCPPPRCLQHCNVIELWGSRSRSRRICLGCKKKEQLNNVFSVKIRGKTLEGSKISADVRCCILNSTASYNLTPRLSECLWGEEETWLCPSIIQCMCAFVHSCVHICGCLCVIWCLVGLGRVPTLF